MRSDRPVNLPLATLFFQMPVTATASILHRASGVVLFIGAIYLFYLLDLALEGDAGFAEAQTVIGGGIGRLALWAVLTALGYHFLAGIKHLLLDFHVGDTPSSARTGAWITIVLTVVAAIGAGVWLW